MAGPVDLLMMLWYFFLFPMEMIFKHIPSVNSLNVAVLQFEVRKPESKRWKKKLFLLFELKKKGVEHELWHCFPCKPMAKLTLLNQCLELK